MGQWLIHVMGQIKNSQIDNWIIFSQEKSFKALQGHMPYYNAYSFTYVNPFQDKHVTFFGHLTIRFPAHDQVGHLMIIHWRMQYLVETGIPLSLKTKKFQNNQIYSIYQLY